MKRSSLVFALFAVLIAVGAYFGLDPTDVNHLISTSVAASPNDVFAALNDPELFHGQLHPLKGHVSNLTLEAVGRFKSLCIREFDLAEDFALNGALHANFRVKQTSPCDAKVNLRITSVYTNALLNVPLYRTWTIERDPASTNSAPHAPATHSKVELLVTLDVPIIAKPFVALLVQYLDQLLLENVKVYCEKAAITIGGQASTQTPQ